jgi:1,4-alpha-glucan branching enzyme
MKPKKQKPSVVSSTVCGPAAIASGGTAKASPEDGAIALKLVAPGAKQVCVAGSFNNWRASAAPLRRHGGKWVGEIRVAPGRYEYLFVVDGQWLPDPSANEQVPNPFGGFNSLLSVT